MNQPEHVLSPGTKVKTHSVLESTVGMYLPQSLMEARKPDTVGVIHGPVAGYGGDVYWIRHNTEGPMVPYSFSEFELESSS